MKERPRERRFAESPPTCETASNKTFAERPLFYPRPAGPLAGDGRTASASRACGCKQCQACAKKFILGGPCRLNAPPARLQAHVRGHPEASARDMREHPVYCHPMNISGILREQPARADIAIDLGTANTRVFMRGAGIVVDEASLCCFKDQGSQSTFVAAGLEALAMLGRTSGTLRVARPLARGVLNDIDSARELIKFAVGKAAGRKRLGSIRALIGMPADATPAERSALLTAARDAGLRSAQPIVEPLAAAFGAGLPVKGSAGSMLVECGAGTTEVVILALGGICLSQSVRVGGDTIDRALEHHLHATRKFLIGPQTAEHAKWAVVDQLCRGADACGVLSIKGRNLLTDKPATIDVPLEELIAVARMQLREIIAAVRTTLNHTPPELSCDILEAGIVLTGGGAMISLLTSELAAATGLHVRVADQPLHCVAKGLGHLMSHDETG